ncbi:acyltransferase [Flavobacterium sp. LHD-80]|uniref:acyltransferase n=1 Tax=Flavobacterium sp. LHD-80 TaxID=3071411 RepID=UPI0027DFCBCE|nr:acyltransferase [Flavobacterium sp. LHD-80]MDQ6471031.1 acyltransferase [Flavobacterium sp. LHD-80]
MMKENKNLMSLLAFFYSLFSLLYMRGIFGNRLILKQAFLKKTKIRINGKNNIIRIHPENRLQNCLLHVSGNNCEIIIGEHCILSNIELWIEDDGGIIQIGHRTTMESGHIAATEGKSISIGQDCMFAHRIEIRNGDSHAIYDEKSMLRINPAESVLIGNHVWLGADSKILKGSIVGDNSIIASGAIVTGKFSDFNAVYAGIPATKIKEGVTWTRDRY